MNDEYTKVEKPAIDQLLTFGYTYVRGEELAPDSPAKERSSWRDVVLDKRLKSALMRINPWLSPENLNKIVHDLIYIRSTSLIEANQKVYENLVKYMSYKQDMGHGQKGQTVKVIDFDNPDNNEFLVVNQFKVHGPKQNIIPDIVIFINGLPMAVIECKSPFITNPMETGINQLLRYSNRRNQSELEGAERLFWYNQMMVSTFGDKATMGTISSGYEHYMEWKDPFPAKISELVEGARSQEIMLKGVFCKENLLDIIRNFTVFETVDGKMIKKMARYQQYRAVHKTLIRLKTGKTQKERGGVIWHTQGSGKSLTMVFVAVKMRRDPELKDYKLVFVTDRTNLDRQLTQSFKRCQDETVQHAKNVKHFKKILANDSSDLVTGMLQKFREKDFGKMEELNASDKIVLLVDEAHRGMYATLATNMNVALPNAPKIAFTGTPLIKSRKTTNEFGSYIDTYTIDQSVNDGATLQIIYEGRESNTKVTGDSLDKLFDAYFEDKSAEEKEAIKKRYGRELAVLEATKRIEMICVDILEHYRNNIQPNDFKAQIVTASRESAVRYKEALDKLGGPESAVIISGDHNDPAHIREHTDRTKQKQYIERFKKPMVEDSLSILIVKDMLLTGFDAPVEQVMYLDRRLMDHGLLQAIARVNRTRTGKTRGYVVDYYGLSDYLKDALELFSSEDVHGALIPIKEELPKLERRHTKVLSHFKGIALSEIEKCVEVLENEEARAQFQANLKKFLRSMDIVMPRPEALPFISDMKRLGQINLAAQNRYRENLYAIAGAGAKVRELIDEHIYSTGIEPRISPVALLAPDFGEHVDSIKSHKAKASEIEHAIKHHITVNIEQDPEYYHKLSKRLEAILNAYHEKWDELVQILMDFRSSIETERGEKAQSVGLSKQEFAYYNILEAEMKEDADYYAPDPETRNRMCDITSEIFDSIKESTYIVDFFQKEDEKKKLRLKIKRVLMASELAPKTKMRNRIIERYMELARVQDVPK
ncbi:MAG: type I restriction endonuclease subunit R [Candidatus Krumholzibacteriota bacterium]|nr:type I restriction endonuclease subunit R [Candidatus Krumholzibacteriota bacterium]